jgi:hypothetical protein
MTNFATIKKQDPFVEVMHHCVSDMKNFLRIDTGRRHWYVSDKSLFLQYLNAYYTPRTIEAAYAYVQVAWERRI